MFLGLSFIPTIALFLLQKPTEAFSIITGGLISLFNLFFLLKNKGFITSLVSNKVLAKGKVLITSKASNKVLAKGKVLIFIRYIILSFIVFFLLYFGFSPIFIAIGFAIFPLSMALSVIWRKE